MLLRKGTLASIAAGDVDLVFRRWKRPTVRTGGTLRTPEGLLQIERVERVSMDVISEDDARRAGIGLKDLLEFLNQREDGEVYRVELGSIVPDPMVVLREDDHLSPEDVEFLTEKLDRLDRVSRRGP